MVTTADVDVNILFLIKLEVCKILQRLSVKLGIVRINVQLLYRLLHVQYYYRE